MTQPVQSTDNGRLCRNSTECSRFAWVRIRKSKSSAMAENGRKAVEAAASKHDVDVVIMDVEMPVMDGIEATSIIRRQNPRLPIVMFSSITSEGARATMDALAAGASDYMPKPSSVGQVSDAMQVLRNSVDSAHQRLGKKIPATKWNWESDPESSGLRGAIASWKSEFR